jgi:hypothetical protein
VILRLCAVSVFSTLRHTFGGLHHQYCRISFSAHTRAGTLATAIAFAIIRDYPGFGEGPPVRRSRDRLARCFIGAASSYGASDKRFGFKTNRSSGNQNRGAFEAARAEIGKGLVGMLERIAGGLGDNTDLGHEAQEINAVLPREIGDRHELPLFP